MAIYHLKAGFISRSSGRSSVQSAAYITGEKLKESRRDLTCLYRNKISDVAFSKTLSLYSNADLSIWDKLEDFEDSYAYKRFLTDLTQQKYINSAQTAMTMVIALPKELPLEESRDLVEDFANKRFVTRGLVVTHAIHKDAGNPHAHLQISRRSLSEKGEISWVKDREICTKKELLATRKLWAELTNHYLEKNGLKERITHKSFVDLGIDLIPSKHEGWHARSLGDASRIVQENKEISNENRERLLEEPDIILKEITHTKATFSQYDLLKNIQKRIGDDENQIRIIFEQALLKSRIVGEGLDGQTRYTTKEYKDLEDQAVHFSQKLRHYDQNIKQNDIKELLEKSYSFLSDAQKDAVIGMTQDDQLSLLVGRAGAGKTTTLKAVAKAYLKAGHHVVGTSLSALAAENLGKEVGVNSATLHSYLYQWKNGIQDLSQNHVILVDEAGMIGTRQWRDLLEIVYQNKCKIIAVGDDHQFKAIEAGDFFRELKENTSSLFYLEEIVRQKQDWMKQASKKFASLEIQEGLSCYEKHGCIHASQDISNDIAKMYVEKVLDKKEGLILAFTNQACQSINDTVRSLLKEKKEIGTEDLFTLNNRFFSKNDLIVFLENNPDNKLIKNGTRGRVLDYKDGLVTVLLTSQKQVIFHLKDNPKIDHGYALTMHKSQGQTVDFSLVATSKYLDAKGLYVSMTRHREEADLFYSLDEFKSFKELSSRLSKFSSKDLVKDYTILPEHSEAYRRVQEYLLTTLDLAATLKEEVIEWNVYRDLKNAQKNLGSEILKDFKSHELFIKQSHLTKENLEITVGLKQRPLSRAEERARERVILYGQKTLEARSLWRGIREKAKLHKHDPLFQNLQQERNSLAKIIHDSYPLHREFVATYRKSFGINQKTITAQANIMPFVRREKDMRVVFDSAQVKEKLNLHIKELAFELLGKPDHQTARQWRYGKKGSVVIQVSGVKQGLYSNFETGEFGNVITFIQNNRCCDPKEALDFGRRWLESGKSISAPRIEETYKESTWKPLPYAPKDSPSLYETPHLSSMLKGRREITRYAYKDIQGNILGYVVRFEDIKGQKITPTLTYCQNNEGKKAWRWKGFGDNRPLYGLEFLSNDKSVLVVEGEKTANAARELFPNYSVVTWSGGAGSVHKSDWSVLKNRDVIIWPDHDMAGRKAVEKIQGILKDAVIVTIPDHFSHKWDLADKRPENISQENLHFMVQDAKNEFLQKFEYQSIYETCEKHYLGYLLNEDHKNLLEVISKETYQEIKLFEGVMRKDITSEKCLETSHLTALYTVRVKMNLDLDVPNQDHFQKAWTIGMIAAKLKERGDHFNNDASLLWAAFQKYDKSLHDGNTCTRIRGDLLKGSAMTPQEERSLAKISQTTKSQQVFEQALREGVVNQKNHERER